MWANVAPDKQNRCGKIFIPIVNDAALLQEEEPLGAVYYSGLVPVLLDFCVAAFASGLAPQDKQIYDDRRVTLSSGTVASIHHFPSSTLPHVFHASDLHVF